MLQLDLNLREFLKISAGAKCNSAVTLLNHSGLD